MTTVQDTFDAMPDTFLPDKAAGMNEVYQFDISGEGGGKWYAQIADGELTVAKGEHAEPTLIIMMDAQNYLDMVAGRLHGQAAFLTGKLKFKGNFALAVKMNTIFKR